MGLDMYLNAEEYVGGWSHGDEGEKSKYASIVEMVEAENLVTEDSPSLYVKVTCGYWRKANHIHQWFVRNVQNGEDNCGNYYVSRGQLEELADACRAVMRSTRLVGGVVHTGTTYDRSGETEHFADGKVLEDSTMAEELLPTQEGFFFGGTDYDEGYWNDLETTIAIVNRALNASTKWEFSYHSSW
jgi:hypothetical protein